MTEKQGRGPCTATGCDKPAWARSLCGNHYQKWRKHGDPNAGGVAYKTPAEALANRVRREGGCLVWTGSIIWNGYGMLRDNTHGGKSRPAHRVAWEVANGPIPDGMVVDHLCYNRACVDVSHLRLTTSSGNAQNRKGAQPSSISGVRNVSQKANGSFVVSMRVGGVSHYGGVFYSIEEATAKAEEMRKHLMPYAQW